MGRLSKMCQWMEANLMVGMTPLTIKKNPALIPMYFIIGSGVVWCVVFSTRTFFFNPDGLNPITGKHNWDRYRDGRDFKLISFSKQIIPCQAPEYRMPGDPDDDSYATTRIGSFVHK